MDVVAAVEKLGYPQSMIIENIEKNALNSCTTSYYLLMIDQNE